MMYTQTAGHHVWRYRVTPSISKSISFQMFVSQVQMYFQKIRAVFRSLHKFYKTQDSNIYIYLIILICSIKFNIYLIKVVYLKRKRQLFKDGQITYYVDAGRRWHVATYDVHLVSYEAQYIPSTLASQSFCFIYGVN